MVGKPVDYWNNVGANLVARSPNRWWRAYCDALNDRWLKQTLAGRIFRHALKTDLFEEAAGGGLGFTVADHVMGIDLAPSTARLAVDRKGLVALAADVRRLPFSDASFDLVVSLSTLDHFSDAHDILCGLREIRRLLASGGTLALTLDNLSNPYVRLRNSLPWPLLLRSRLVPYFIGATLTHTELQKALTATGFRLLHSTAIMHVPRVLVVPVAGRAASFLTPVMQRLEILARLPTRYLTGLYSAVVAEAINIPSRGAPASVSTRT